MGFTITDAQLKKFCLRMVESKTLHSNQGKQGDSLALAMFSDMEEFIRENRTEFSELTQADRESLAKIFTAYAPPVSKEGQITYNSNYRSHSPFVPNSPLVFVINSGPGGCHRGHHGGGHHGGGHHGGGHHGGGHHGGEHHGGGHHGGGHHGGGHHGGGHHGGGHHGGGCGNLPGWLLIGIALIIVLTLGIAATIKAAIDIFIYIDAIANKEGRAQALLNVSMLVILFSAAVALTVSFLLATLAAGNPVFLATLFVASITAVGAYSSYWILARILDVATPLTSMNNPDNPYKNFTMTPKEAEKLEQKGISSLKARVAIILLQSQMGSDAPAWYNRSELQQIRKLRFGEERTIRLGPNLTLDCSKDALEKISARGDNDITAGNDSTLPRADAFFMDPFMVIAYPVDAFPSAPPLQGDSEAKKAAVY